LRTAAILTGWRRLMTRRAGRPSRDRRAGSGWPARGRAPTPGRGV